MEPEVLWIEEPVGAWNMDGSSDARAERGSWLQDAEAATGRKRGRCSFDACPNTAQVGGHLWVQGIGCCIAPICRACNRPNNRARMQGAGPRLRSRIAVTKTAMTKGMRAAERRIPASGEGRRQVRGAPSTSASPEQQARGACYRCGRPGHFASQCYAKTHASGASLERGGSDQRSPKPARWVCRSR